VRTLAPLIFIPLVLLASLTTCTKPSNTAANEPKPMGLESIPPADPSKYPSFQDLSNWQNPYLVVREDGIGFVDLTNHEIRLLQPDQIQAELASLPESAWPYGRVVLVTEAAPKNRTDQVKTEMRKTRGLLLGTLKELDVQVREAP
jgi:hypothetical protein